MEKFIWEQRSVTQNAEMNIMETKFISILNFFSYEVTLLIHCSLFPIEIEIEFWIKLWMTKEDNHSLSLNRLAHWSKTKRS